MGLSNIILWVIINKHNVLPIMIFKVVFLQSKILWNTKVLKIVEDYLTTIAQIIQLPNMIYLLLPSQLKTKVGFKLRLSDDCLLYLNEPHMVSPGFNLNKSVDVHTCKTDGRQFPKDLGWSRFCYEMALLVERTHFRCHRLLLSICLRQRGSFTTVG